MYLFYYRNDGYFPETYRLMALQIDKRISFAQRLAIKISCLPVFNANIVYRRTKQIRALHSRHLSFLFANNNNVRGLRARTFLSRAILSATFERSPVKKDRNNVIVTTSQCGPYLRGISTSISQGYHWVKSAGVPAGKTIYLRGPGRKLQTRVCLCVAIKKILNPAPSNSRNLLCFHFRRKMAAGFFPRTLNAAHSAVSFLHVPENRQEVKVVVFFSQTKFRIR